jgi:hypothetical protein
VKRHIGGERGCTLPELKNMEMLHTLCKLYHPGVDEAEQWVTGLY